MAISNPTIETGLRFEESFADFQITAGAVSLVEGPSHGGFKAGSVTRLIQADQSVEVIFEWETAGLMVPFLAGNWKAEVFLEKMGRHEFDLPNNVVIEPYDPNVCEYQCIVPIPPKTIDPGTYRVVVCLTFTSLDDPNTPGPVAAFGDLGVIKVYHEKGKGRHRARKDAK